MVNHKLTMSNNIVFFPRKGLGQKYIPRNIVCNTWEVTVLPCLGANWISDQVSTFRHHIFKKMTWKKSKYGTRNAKGFNKHNP